MKKSLALALSAVALVASVPVGLKDELERKVLAMGSACAAMEGAWNHRHDNMGRFVQKCAMAGGPTRRRQGRGSLSCWRHEDGTRRGATVLALRRAHTEQQRDYAPRGN